MLGTCEEGKKAGKPNWSDRGEHEEREEHAGMRNSFRLSLGSHGESHCCKAPPVALRRTGCRGTEQERGERVGDGLTQLMTAH